MSDSKKGTAFLKEFRGFISFLQSLWGVLAGMSVLFPISNALMKQIPIEEYKNKTGIDGGLAGISPELLTGVATLISLFIVLWTYGQRHEIKSKMEMNTIRRQAIFSFALGFIALSVYLLVYNYTKISLWGDWFRWEEPLTTISFGLSGIVCLFSYSAFFALMTRAFMLLGMIEYFVKGKIP